MCIAYLFFGESIIALRSTATPLGLHVILRSLHPTIWNQNNTFWFTHCETLLFALRKSGARMCVGTGIACAECLRGIKHFMQLAGVLLRYSDNLITVVLPAERTSLHINCLLINRYHEPKEKGLKKEQKKNKTANETKKNIGSRGEETFGTPALIENVSPHPVHRTTKPTEGGRVRPLDHQWTNPWLCVWFPNGTTALVSKERLQRYVYLELRSLLSMWEPGFDAIAIRFRGIAHPRAIPRCE